MPIHLPSPEFEVHRLTGELQKQQKIIVAVFLCLGKAMEMLPEGLRSKVQIKESEIAAAWKSQTSPVRLVTHRSPVEDEWCSSACVPTDRVFQCVLGQLDLTKTGMHISGPMPRGSTTEEEKSNNQPHKPKRVFQLE